jgi:hypothetical protein
VPSDVPFVFHDGAGLIGKGEPELADQVVAYWTNFAATGRARHVAGPGLIRLERMFGQFTSITTIHR